MRSDIFRELRLSLNRKTIAVLLLVLLFAFGISIFEGYQYADRRQEMMKMRAMETTGLLMTEETNIPVYESIGGEELRSVLEERVSAMKTMLEGYQTGDAFLALDGRLASNQLLLEAINLGYPETNQDTENLELQIQRDQILKTQHILPIDDLLESHDGVHSVLYLLKTYMLYLLPMVVMLLGADRLSGELRTGSVRFLLQFDRPRWKLITAKAVAVVAWSVVALIGMVIFAFLGGMFFAGPGDFRYPITAAESFITTGEETYVSAGILLLRAGVILICGVLFYTSLAILFSCLTRWDIASLAGGVVLSVGGAWAIHQWLVSTESKVAAVLPFQLADSFGFAMGRLDIPQQEQVANTAGLISSQSTGEILVVGMPFSGLLACVLLVIWTALCYALALGIFARRDVT